MNNKENLFMSPPSSIKVHFVGIGGAGMSVLARLMHKKGYIVSGSDRDFDHFKRKDFFHSLQESGINLVKQNGEGIDKSVDLVITSTAVESHIADIEKANQLNIPIIHRSVALEYQIENYKSIAVAGTSGKTTVTGMIGWILSHSNQNPTILNGAAVKDLDGIGKHSDFQVGTSDWIVFEADESDGSLVNFHPDIGIILNVGKDHKPITELIDIFKKFSLNIKNILIVYDELFYIFREILNCKVFTFGFSEKADFQIKITNQNKWSSSFRINEYPLDLQVPGIHNILNAGAAFAALNVLKMDPVLISNQLSTFKGIKRRFEIIGRRNNITVIDDYAHNPDKIKASLSTAKTIAERVLAIFQPHGFGPTKFLFKEYVKVFIEETREIDHIFILPIFYSGGTVKRDISSQDLVNTLSFKKKNVAFVLRTDLARKLKSIVTPGDLVLLMGARDPTLPELAKTILQSLSY